VEGSPQVAIKNLIVENIQLFIDEVKFPYVGSFVNNREGKVSKRRKLKTVI